MMTPTLVGDALNPDGFHDSYAGPDMLQDSLKPGVPELGRPPPSSTFTRLHNLEFRYERLFILGNRLCGLNRIVHIHRAGRNKCAPLFSCKAWKGFRHIEQVIYHGSIKKIKQFKRCDVVL